MNMSLGELGSGCAMILHRDFTVPEGAQSNPSEYIKVLMIF